MFPTEGHVGTAQRPKSVRRFRPAPRTAPQVFGQVVVCAVDYRFQDLVEVREVRVDGGCRDANASGDRTQADRFLTLLRDQGRRRLDDLAAKALTLAAGVARPVVAECHADHFTSVYLWGRNLSVNKHPFS
jgi:hypothetical protein